MEILKVAKPYLKYEILEAMSENSLTMCRFLRGGRVHQRFHQAVFYLKFFIILVHIHCLLKWNWRSQTIVWGPTSKIGVLTLKFKFRFEHFPRNTRILRFDGPSNCFYLFKNQWQTFSLPGNVCHSTSKLLKCALVQTLDTFPKPLLWIFPSLQQ